MSLKRMFPSLYKDGGDGESENSDTVVKEAVSKQPQKINAVVPINTAGGVVSGTNYKKVLDEVCEGGKKNTADFWAFHKALAKMDGKPISEDQKYVATSIAYEGMGVTPQQLVASSDYYIGLIDAEDKRFHGELADAEKSQIETKKALIEKLSHENDEMAKKIQENNTKAQQLNNEIFTSTNQLNAEKMNFENQFSIYKAVFTDSVTKIKQYLYASTTK